MWNANTNPRDDHSEPLVAGVSYWVTLSGSKPQICTVSEDDYGNLWAKFNDGPPQRVDEMSQFCEWERITDNGDGAEP